LFDMQLLEKVIEYVAVFPNRLANCRYSGKDKKKAEKRLCSGTAPEKSGPDKMVHYRR